MVCRKMIIGYFGGCNCEICLGLNSDHEKLEEKFFYKKGSDVYACKNFTGFMCLDCFDKILKENESTSEESENILDDIKHMKDNKHPHPGKVANDLLVIKGYRGALSEDMASPTLCGDILSMNSASLEEFFCGYVDICHATAYKLAKVIEGTDVRFWMELQEKYDAYIQKNK